MVTSQGIHLVFDRSFLKGDTALMVPRTSDGRVLFVIPWHGHAVAGTTDTPVDAPSLEPKPLDEEIEFILETAGRYLTRPPTRADVLAVYVGLRPLVKSDEGRGQDLCAVARSRDPRGHLGTADHYRRQMDHLSAHGRGLRGPCNHAGPAARCGLAQRRICGSTDMLKPEPCLKAQEIMLRCTAPTRRPFARCAENPALACAAASRPALYRGGGGVGGARGDGADGGRCACTQNTRAVSQCSVRRSRWRSRWHDCWPRNLAAMRRGWQHR